MRILLSIHHELDRNAGAPGATIRLGEAFRGLGHHVDILSFDDMTSRAAMHRYRFPWFIASEIKRRPAYDVYDLSSGDGWVAAMQRKITKRGTRSIIVARSHGLEHVLHDSLIAETKASGHALSWKYPLYNGGFRLWECRQSFARSDLALFLNQFDQDYAVEKLGVSRSRTGRVTNGIGQNFVDTATTMAENLQDVSRPTNIAFVGSYVERKGIRFLREAMIKVMERNQDVKLGYFGTGVQAATILDAYPEPLRARISVTPAYANENLPAMLAAFHILAFPSLSEGFPLAPAEAMACGLVPIVSDIPGPSDIVKDGHNGLVVAPASSGALEGAIERLLLDGALWNALRRQAVADAKDYSWRSVAPHTEALYAAHLNR